ncbi:hypothetical protein GCM10010831_20690 [Psychroflexus salis]|uniref:Uncharacterized protein n=2 Tax=Psychroflexus salis TaxID=1526574 RepID=A0A917A006_9FLAO|nr:hypothetical protein GCM10010831_20690 [Psychroflexus salis]
MYRIFIFGKNTQMKYIFSIILSFLAFQLQAQVKNETEKRIKKKDVPEEVMEWFKDAYEKRKKVKWFYQTDGEKTVYEAKLMYKKQKHSVEILPNGNIVNIEVLIDFDTIEANSKNNIETYLYANYTKFSIKKVQIQYTGSNDDLEDLIDEDELNEAITINYEIEFYGKNEIVDELWEGLFNSDGKLMEHRKIKLKATDNLDY